jgi:hypothetical protein
VGDAQETAVSVVSSGGPTEADCAQVEPFQVKTSEFLQ